MTDSQDLQFAEEDLDWATEELEKIKQNNKITEHTDPRLKDILRKIGVYEKRVKGARQRIESRNVCESYFKNNYDFDRKSQKELREKLRQGLGLSWRAFRLLCHASKPEPYNYYGFLSKNKKVMFKYFKLYGFDYQRIKNNIPGLPVGQKTIAELFRWVGIQPNSGEKTFNKDHAKACINYLEKHGYKTMAPGGKA